MIKAIFENVKINERFIIPRVIFSNGVKDKIFEP